MTAQYQVQGDIAVITLNNPPVNGLGLSTRQGIADGMAKANADATVKAIVITGSDGAFCGGADIREFGTEKSQTKPRLRDIVDQLDAAIAAGPASRRVRRIAGIGEEGMDRSGRRKLDHGDHGGGRHPRARLGQD